MILIEGGFGVRVVLILFGVSHLHAGTHLAFSRIWFFFGEKGALGYEYGGPTRLTPSEADYGTHQPLDAVLHLMHCVCICEI